MANYSNLITSIQSVVKTNGAGAITGANLQTKLLEMVASLGAGYQFMGVATPSTNPGSPDQKVFYMAEGPGAYTNFGGVVVADDELAVLAYGSSWSKMSIGAVPRTHHTLTYQYTYSLVVSSGNQNAKFPLLNIRKGRKYTFTATSDVHNTGYIKAEYRNFNYATINALSQRNYDLINPLTFNYDADVNGAQYIILVRGVQSAGTLTLNVTEEWDTYGVSEDLSKISYLPGKNLANPVDFRQSTLHASNHAIRVTAGSYYSTGYIFVPNGESVVCNVYGGSSGENKCAFFKEYGDLSWIDGTLVTHDLSAVRVLTNNLGYDAWAVFTIGGANLTKAQVERGSTPTYFKAYNPISGYLPQETDYYSLYGTIGGAYPEEAAIVAGALAANGTGMTKLHFCQITDTHGGGFRYADEFTDLAPASFLVNTGDLVNDSYNDSYATTQATILAMTKPCYIVLGNHDCNKSPSLQARFSKYFDPINAHNGMSGNTKTYYSIDYATEKVKCIYLDMNDGYDDCTGLAMNDLIAGKMSGTQINWFAAQLQAAASAGLHVVCFIHISPDYLDTAGVPSDWFDTQVQRASGVTFLCDVIDAFISGSSVQFSHNGNSYSFTFGTAGHFAGWVCGHLHADANGWMQSHPNQFCVTAPRNTTSKEDGTWRGDRLNVTFNYVTIDTKFNRLAVLRIGNQDTLYGTKRSSFSVIYK